MSTERKRKISNCKQVPSSSAIAEKIEDSQEEDSESIDANNDATEAQEEKPIEFVENLNGKLIFQ